METGTTTSATTSAKIGTVERTIWIDAPRERAWRAVTQADQLEKWYATGGFTWEIPTLQVGAQVKFYNSPTEILHATIEVVDPPRQFTLRWQADPAHADPPHVDVSLVTTFLLVEENGGTRASIVESGYEALPDDARREWMEATGAGYAMSVENLKAHVEGRPLPY